MNGGFECLMDDFVNEIVKFLMELLGSGFNIAMAPKIDMCSYFGSDHYFIGEMVPL